MLARTNKDSEGRQTLFIGLSKENMKRLADKQPIRTNQASHGNGMPEGLTLIIFAGDTEIEMIAELTRQGLVGAGAVAHIDTRLFKG